MLFRKSEALPIGDRREKGLKMFGKKKKLKLSSDAVYRLEFHIKRLLNETDSLDQTVRYATGRQHSLVHENTGDINSLDDLINAIDDISASIANINDCLYLYDERRKNEKRNS